MKRSSSFCARCVHAGGTACSEQAQTPRVHAGRTTGRNCDHRNFGGYCCRQFRQRGKRPGDRAVRTTLRTSGWRALILRIRASIFRSTSGNGQKTRIVKAIGLGCRMAKWTWAMADQVTTERVGLSIFCRPWKKRPRQTRTQALKATPGQYVCRRSTGGGMGLPALRTGREHPIALVVLSFRCVRKALTRPILLGNVWTSFNRDTCYKGVLGDSEQTSGTGEDSPLPDFGSHPDCHNTADCNGLICATLTSIPFNCGKLLTA